MSPREQWVTSADATTTECPTCNGLGQTLAMGGLVSCEECSGAGRVPAMEFHDPGPYGENANGPTWVEPILREEFDAWASEGGQ